MLNNSVSKVSEALRRLIGRKLNSVQFIMDYIILHFDGPFISCYVDPIVNNQTRYDLLTPNFRDALCELITKRVNDVYVSDDILEIRFDFNVSIVIDLREEARVTPAAFEFAYDSELWIVYL